MLSLHQLETIGDYLRLIRSDTNKNIDAVATSYLETDFKAVLLTEQRRRERELSRLIKATDSEILFLRRKKGITPCQEETDGQTVPTPSPGTKQKNSAGGKKSKGRAVGTYGTRNSAKNGNAGNKSRKQKSRRTKG